MNYDNIQSLTKMILTSKLSDAEIEEIIKAAKKAKETLSGFILKKLGQIDMSVEELSERANIGRSTMYKIIKGKMKPEGDRLLQIAFALKLSAEETQRLLRLGGRAQLNTDSERDIRILFALKQQKMLEEVDYDLSRLGLKPISRSEE